LARQVRSARFDGIDENRPLARLPLRNEASLPDRLLTGLYDEYGPRLYRYALLILADRAAAEDAVQEAFCNVVRLLRRQPDAATPAYLITAVRHQSYTILRQRRRVSAAAGPLLEPCAPDASEEERLILEDALKRLSVEQREVVHLKVFEFEGFTLQEIAEVCGVSANTVASRYRYALVALRRALSASERTP
jgi:RNA polymerase sigma-70 factor, ECF subfamily